MIKNWFSAEMGTQALLVTATATGDVTASRRLNSAAQLLTHCLSLQPPVSASARCGVYVIIGGNTNPNDAIGPRALDYFKNMPGLTGPFALHEAATPSRGTATFTFLDQRFGFLHAVDQLLLDLSEDRADSGLMLYVSSTSSPYAFSLYVRSKNWLEEKRPSFELAFEDQAEELIRRFGLQPLKSQASP